MSWEPYARFGMMAVGYYFFGPLGAMAGGFAGGMMFPDEFETEMPTLHDMPIQSSAIGIPITLVYGTTRVAGNIIWMGPSQSYQFKHSSGGKGGGDEQTAYSTQYRRSFLISICEGPATVLRMWEDKELKYVDSAFDFTQYGPGEEWEPGGVLWQIIHRYREKEVIPPVTFYDGTDNSVISTLIGEDYAEYSNLCLAYFEDYELGGSQRIPNFMFEVSSLPVGQLPLYVGTDEAPAGNDLFETNYSGNKIYQSKEGHATNGIYDIVVQPSTNRIIVAGVAAKIYESDWTEVASFPTSASKMLVDPDDDEYIYLAGAGGISKYDIATQTLQWSNTDYSAYGVCISEDSGKLYVCGIIGEGINEVNRDTGVHVRNLETARGHGSIEYYKAHLFATGSRQTAKSVWKYNEVSGNVISSYDTGGGTHKIIIVNSKIFVCGQRSSTYTPTGGLTGFQTIFKFDELLTIEAAYDDGNAVYWLNDINYDAYKNQIVVSSRGDSVDENGNTANLRWFNESLVLQLDLLMYDTNSNALVTAFGISPARIKVDYYIG